MTPQLYRKRVRECRTAAAAHMLELIHKGKLPCTEENLRKLREANVEVPDQALATEKALA